MKKKALGLLSVTGLLAMAVSFLTPGLAKSMTFMANGVCDHNGYHYEGLELTRGECGVKPFYVCCKCHEFFLDKGVAPEGSWTDSEMSLEDYQNKVICYKDDRLIANPYKALDSQAEFYQFFNFATWGSECIPGKQMQIVSDNLNVVANAILSKSQDFGANYLNIKVHIDTPDGRAPKRLLAFHGGGAADKESFVNIDANGDAVITVNLKSYLYDITGSFKLGINFYIADDKVYSEGPGEFLASANAIKDCIWTITEVTPITELNVDKGVSSNFDVKYDSEGVVTEFSFTDIDVNVTPSIGWNGLMFKLTKAYWAELYNKGYRKVVVSPSYSIDAGAGGIYYFDPYFDPSKREYFPGNGATHVIELVEGGLDIGFAKVNFDGGKHYNDRITFKLIVTAKTEEEFKVKTMLSSQDNLWRYFHHGAWGECHAGIGPNASMSFIAGNAEVTHNLFADLYAAGMTHFEFDLELDLRDKSTYQNVNRWVYTTNNASSELLVYAEGDYNGKTHIDINFSKAFEAGLGGSESLYFRGRVQMDGVLVEAPDCLFTITNVNCY